MKNTVIITLITLAIAATAANAQPAMYRETFDEPDSTNLPLNGDLAKWHSVYTKNGDTVATYTRFWNVQSTLGTPVPTANSNPTYAWQPGMTAEAISHSVKMIWSRMFVTNVDNLGDSNSYITPGSVTWNGEYQPAFNAIDGIQWDQNLTNTSDKLKALVRVGGHWYLSRDEATQTTASTYEQKSINWQTTIWDQLDDNMYVWRTFDGYDPRVALNVSLAGATVQTFGLLNWQTAGNMTVDNITLIPEPATMTLLGIGGLALIRRKR